MLKAMHDIADMLQIKKRSIGHLYQVNLASKLCLTGSAGMSKLTTLWPLLALTALFPLFALLMLVVL
jgi:hypothetical protein